MREVCISYMDKLGVGRLQLEMQYKLTEGTASEFTWLWELYLLFISLCSGCRKPVPSAVRLIWLMY